MLAPEAEAEAKAGRGKENKPQRLISEGMRLRSLWDVCGNIGLGSQGVDCNRRSGPRWGLVGWGS